MITSEGTPVGDCDYTCSLRIEGDYVDVAALDACLDIPGKHSVLPKRRRGEEPGGSFMRWEFAAVNDSGGDQWCSLADALEQAVDIVLPARKAIESEVSRSNPHWWCGCFHNRPGSSVRMTAACVEKLADVGAKIVLDNYSPEGASPAMYGRSGVGSCPSSIGFFHRYAFAVTDQYGNSTGIHSVVDVESSSWSNFGEGLSASVQWIAANGIGAAKEIVCLHSQFAFDGGPCIEREHLLALARAKLGLTIVWEFQDIYEAVR